MVVLRFFAALVLEGPKPGSLSFLGLISLWSRIDPSVSTFGRAENDPGA